MIYPDSRNLIEEIEYRDCGLLESQLSAPVNETSDSYVRELK